jgi:hypothetical protein
VEMKQALSDSVEEQCRELARTMAAKLKE